jgi:folate-binding protein YgfZ
VDVLGPLDAVRAFVDESGLRRGTADEFEALRIAAGVPVVGVDIDDSTIPQEAGLEVDAVSFTKGCFIGQELVCRIDSRGHVNRFLRRLSLPGTAVPPVGAEVARDDKVVGTVTSATAVPGEGRVVALAMLRREVEPPAEVAVRWDQAVAPAVVLA